MMKTTKKTMTKTMTDKQFAELNAAKKAVAAASSNVSEGRNAVQAAKGMAMAASRTLRTAEQRLHHHKKRVVEERKKLDRLVAKYKGWAKPKQAKSDQDKPDQASPANSGLQPPLDRRALLDGTEQWGRSE